MDGINNIKLKLIKAPALNESNYGDEIEKQFENINSNFSTLGSHDFIKGDKGDSVNIEACNLNLEKYRKIKEDIKSAIKGNLNKDQLHSITNKDGKEINWDDYLNQENPIIYLIKDSNGNIISSLNFEFMDARFYMDFNNAKTVELYGNLVDTTCTIYYQKNEEKVTIIKKISSWPTLYYDKDINDFCWMYRGTRTGLPARGPQGKSEK